MAMVVQFGITRLNRAPTHWGTLAARDEQLAWRGSRPLTPNPPRPAPPSST
ncbi:hypothetical protein I547_6348 [Mycobacterium kansasii 824]|nr:hypothetical protein I547_6348 [Mycobacterium kansasii 824]